MNKSPLFPIPYKEFVLKKPTFLNSGQIYPLKLKINKKFPK